MERQLVRLPNGASPETGLASMMPGAGAAQLQPRAVQSGRVRINAQAPRTEQRVGGVLADGRQLAQGQLAAAQAELNTGRSLTEAVTSVGRGVNAIAQQVIKVREDMELTEADAIMKHAAMRFKANLPEDPAGWMDSYEKMSQDVRADVMGDPDKRKSRFLKRKLEQNFKAWDAENRVGLETMSIRQNLNIAKAKSDFAWEEGIKRADMRTLESIAAARVNSGLSTPEIEQSRLDQASEQIDRNGLAVLIERDPFMAEEALKEKPSWMSDLEQIKYEKAVRQSQHYVRMQQMDGIENTLAAQPNMAQKDFQALLDGSDLTESQKVKYVEVWREGRKPDFEAMRQLRVDMQRITPASKEDVVWEFSERIRNEVHKQFQPQFYEEIKNRLGPSQGSSIESGLTPNASNLLKTANRLIGATINDAKANSPLMDLRQIELAQIALESEMVDYLKENPEATAEDVYKTLKQLSVPASEELSLQLMAPGIYKPSTKTVQSEIQEVENGLKAPAYEPVWKTLVKDFVKNTPSDRPTL